MPTSSTASRNAMKTLLAKYFHLVLGATVMGPKFYGFAFAGKLSWGFGIFFEREKRVKI